MSDAKFIPGLFVKPPHERAPDFIKNRLSIKNADLIAYLQKRLNAGEEWTNADIKESREGKVYAALDEWKPEGNGGRSRAPSRDRSVASEHDTPQPAATGDFQDDDIPF
jgi:hypothetical protein